MLRTRNDQPTLWESILPDDLLRLPAELARVDVLLDDEVFFAPFRAYFDPVFGRPSIPIENYLRLMFLKFRYRLGLRVGVCRGGRLDRVAAVRTRCHCTCGGRGRRGSASRPTRASAGACCGSGTTRKVRERHEGGPAA